MLVVSQKMVFIGIPKKLKKNNIIRRVGGDFGGHWEVLI